MAERVEFKRMKEYSAIQIAASSLIGTPLAAAFLLAMNYADGKRPRKLARSVVAFSTIGGGYFLVTLINPAQSRWIDTLIFLLFTGAALLANHLMVDRKGDLVSAHPRSWWSVVAISIAFLAVWVLFVVFVFNPGL